MSKTTPIIKYRWILSVTLAAGLFLTGCGTFKSGSHFSACCDNVVNRIPVITCQPLDVTNAVPGQPSYFYAGAEGKDLTYQWFFIGGGQSPEPQEVILPTAHQPLLEVIVDKKSYGLYFCNIQSATGFGHATQTRLASLGGVASTAGGGVFAAVQDSVIGGSSLTVCGTAVGAKKTAFPSQTPDAPDNGFLGELLEVVGTQTNAILNTRYVLQFYYTGVDKPCAKSVVGSTNLVECSPLRNNALTAGHGYYITAFFKAGQAPPLGTQVIVSGSWTQH
jgi:hypothetical protein